MASTGEPARAKGDVPTTRSKINEYFDSLNDHEATTKVICYGAAVDAPPEAWPIHRVKSYFADRARITNTSPILCTQLPLRRLPRVISEIHGRQEKSTLQRLVVEHPRFLGRTIVAEKGTCYTVESLEFGAWVSVVHGQTTLGTSAPGAPPKTMHLMEGSISIYPKGNKLMFAFLEDMVLNMGYIAPTSEEMDMEGQAAQDA